MQAAQQQCCEHLIMYDFILLSFSAGICKPDLGPQVVRNFSDSLLCAVQHVSHVLAPNLTITWGEF